MHRGRGVFELDENLGSNRVTVVIYICTKLIRGGGAIRSAESAIWRINSHGHIQI